MEAKSPKVPGQLDAPASMVVIKDSVWEKNPEVVPKNSKVVIKDKNKNKNLAPKVPKVPKLPKKKNPTKVIIKGAKVPKNRPPRSQGSGYYSSYYVGDKRSGGRVRVWVWVWA
ncbi:hypothetical protein N0V85_000740 [Neurospora sp. IMI 360204]|nr:hypothetical protein N0V85_000740 [Neurospora sp. IMI 360204]